MVRYRFIIFVGLVLAVLIWQCKSAGKAMKAGEYYDAVVLATKKLKDSPAHSSSLDILKSAYPKALDAHLGAIKKLEANASGFYWEEVVKHYQKLNDMYDHVSTCTPCLNALEAQSFRTEEDKARERAAEARYHEGDKWLALRTRDEARKAYDHFEVANRLYPRYRDVESKLSRAFELATFKVVVEQVQVPSKMYQLSNQYFQDRINEFLKSNGLQNRFVRFYSPVEAETERIKPDHVIILQFDDFVVGQTMIERNTETVTRDSVKIGETKSRDKVVPVYGKVTAKFTHARKTVVSGGVLDVLIEDYETKRQVFQDKLSGQYTWTCEWGSFSGDERALSPAQKKMAKQQELTPMPPQQMFIEFSKPLYDQLTRKLRSFYQKY